MNNVSKKRRGRRIAYSRMYIVEDRIYKHSERKKHVQKTFAE